MGDGPLSGRRGAGAQVPGAGDAGRPAVEVTDELLDRRAAADRPASRPRRGGGRPPGVTTDLSVRYRRPVPLDVPLRIWGRVTGTEGRRVSAVGGITTAAEPDIPLVEAEARFARLRLDQARRLFSHLASPDAANPDEAHD